MAKARVTKEEFDGLDKILQDEYQEITEGAAKGKFQLKVTPVDGLTLEDNKNLKSAFETTKSELKTVKATLAEFGDLTPVVAKEAVAKVGEMDGWDKDKKTQEVINHRVTEAQKTWNKEKEKLEVKLKKAVGSLEEATIADRATRAITAAKGSPDLLLPHITRVTSLRETAEGSFAVQIIDPTTKAERMSPADPTRPMNIDELVSEMRESSTFARAFDGEQTTGSGGGKGENGGGDAGSRGQNGTGGGTGGSSGAPRVVRPNGQNVLQVDPDDVLSGKVVVKS